MYTLSLLKVRFVSEVLDVARYSVYADNNYDSVSAT